MFFSRVQIKLCEEALQYLKGLAKVTAMNTPVAVEPFPQRS